MASSLIAQLSDAYASLTADRLTALAEAQRLFPGTTELQAKWVDAVMSTVAATGVDARQVSAYLHAVRAEGRKLTPLDIHLLRGNLGSDRKTPPARPAGNLNREQRRAAARQNRKAHRG